jgi:mono/diheme cytochrome c family protein
MKAKQKLGYFGIIVCLLATMWVISATATAHEGHKRKNAPLSAKKLKNPLTATKENITQGRALFNQHCASCHGQDGKGKTTIATSMKSKPTDLTGSAMQGITNGEIYWVITNGIKLAGMPAYKTKANTQARWQMTLYVKHLMGAHPHAEAR